MLACFYWAKSQSHDFKNHIIAFYTQKNIRWPNFMKIEQFVFSNDLAQDSVTVKNANFSVHKIFTFLRNKAILWLINRVKLIKININSFWKVRQ